MKTRSCKNKAIRLQNYVKDKIIETYPELTIDDVKSNPMNLIGRDILLSQEAQKLFPISVECKNQEKISIWAALKQAEINAGVLYPAVVFKRNKSKIYVTLEFNDFMKLIKK